MAIAVEDIRHRMDRMYRPQKYFYDLTRKYYLLGRDRLIAELGVQSGQSLLDIGCGTGRNLALIGQLYPAARLFGLDAAEPMLEVARRRLERAAVRVSLARAVAEQLDPETLFGERRGFDHVTISYCLSMVDAPETAVRAAAAALAPGGTLHIVDFGDMGRLPAWCRGAMTGWLARFHVHHKPIVEPTLHALAETGGGRVQSIEIARRYAMLMRLARAPLR